MNVPSGQTSPNEIQWQFFLTAYEHEQAAMIQNEELGERRVATLLTLISAAGVALGLFDDKSESTTVLTVAAVAAGVVSVISFATLLRVIHRDIATSQAKVRLRMMRRYVAAENAAYLISLPYGDDADDAHHRERRWRPSSGGIVEIVALLFALALAVAVLCGVSAAWPDLGIAHWLAAVLCGASAWITAIFVVRKKYRKGKILKEKPE